MKAIRLNHNPDEGPTYLIPDEEKIAATQEREVTPKKAASLLGVTVGEIGELVRTGHLRKNPGGKIPVEDVEGLLNQGDEVELELREADDAKAAPPAPDKAAPAVPAKPQPRASRAAAPLQDASPAPAKRLVAANPDEEDAAHEEDEPAVFEGDCPYCGEPVQFTGNVHRFACPCCGAAVAVRDEAPLARRNPPGGVAVVAGRTATAARALATRARLLPLVR